VLPAGRSLPSSSVLPTNRAPTADSPKIRRLQVPSKLGHGNLTIDPKREPYRVRLPKVLQRTGQNFDATINICVAANGSVTNVKFLDSAGPMIDPHLASAVSRWRYRPLLESGQAVPFCYVLRYEFEGR
jgi:outer membrane biosynthesis protein TonB